MTAKLHPSLLAAVLLCALGVLRGASLNAAESYRASYYKDGEIHITVLGQAEGKAITTGHWDFKPSWAITSSSSADSRTIRW